MNEKTIRHPGLERQLERETRFLGVRAEVGEDRLVLTMPAGRDAMGLANALEACASRICSRCHESLTRR